MAILAVESGLPFVSGLDPDDVVGAPQVDLRHNLRTRQLTEDVRDDRQWVRLPLGYVVEASVVDTQSKGAILLLDEQDRSAHGRSRFGEEPGPKVLLDVLAQDLVFRS